MSSGKFGTPDPRVNTKLHKPSRVADSLMRRELGVEGVGLGARANRLISQVSRRISSLARWLNDRL